ncbi:hypothetical protein RGE_36670 [Rubrivivax gelatinosus IL144]|uniref:Uncharacterized protein n=1 Tax=Rubrivivax gelatinosus (strain NBRC 100245 / IL144) TaxID=983917 RepID=I0HVG9_RUBGI|nr:hypothetical protein RGE_36670 [Rubrivivax gelatinosus IL144]
MRHDLAQIQAASNRKHEPRDSPAESMAEAIAASRGRTAKRADRGPCTT